MKYIRKKTNNLFGHFEKNVIFSPKYGHLNIVLQSLSYLELLQKTISKATDIQC